MMSVGLELTGAMAVGELARGEDGGEDLQADVGGEQEERRWRRRAQRLAAWGL